MKRLESARSIFCTIRDIRINFPEHTSVKRYVGRSLDYNSRPERSNETSGIVKVSNHERVESIADCATVRIFISYAREDRDPVIALYRYLKRHGFTPWMDKEDMPPGAEWRLEIPKIVHRSDVVLVCVSNQSTRKIGYLQKEIRIALEAVQERPIGEVYLIPVRLENCQIPSQLANWQAIDLFAQNGLDRLIQALRAKVVVNL